MVVEEIAEGVKNLTVTGDAAASGGEGQRRGGGGSSNRIQVSNTKKPLFFYVNLAKVRLTFSPYAPHLSVILLPTRRFQILADLVTSVRAEVYATARRCRAIRSWDGCVPPSPFFLTLFLHIFITAIATVVTVAEILKNNGFAVEKKIRTSTVEINDESRGRPFQKAKIEIILGKSDKFDELMAAAAEERGEVEDGEEQA
ncbi:Alba DNA/RNA-binding protein [Zea mays]|uniref:Alba DNA/RNA-binding protein n=1 Tax=Zea mays TaxID=4577 RepID=A0A1D6MK43_MAIZE|nr:Alba DNA/RNA-binding protein [Zea mays]